MSLEYRVAAFVVLSVAVMFADSRFDYLDRVRFTLGFLTAPVYWLADTPARISNWIDDVFVSHGDLIEENERLREELLFAQRELQLLAGLATENNRLRALQEASAGVEGRVLAAEIINVSSTPGTRRVLINRGATDGVLLGQALLDANGLMGQVVEVLPFTSWVMLITDSRHGTPVQVNRNGERAVARGSRGDVPELELEFVPDTSDIEVGDLLVSSGLGQRFPKDYPVAEVTSVVHDRGQPFAVIKARPLAQMDSTRHVMLLTMTENEAERGDGVAPAWVDTTQNKPAVPIEEQIEELSASPQEEVLNPEPDSVSPDEPLPSEVADILPEEPTTNQQE
ncbi:MAG: rod shape-determining protein MreC [Pseudomonadales bacterium]|nr:rod shape-determining protein MreC [Pseudomonadales bacterium]MCP5330569.1 rod shape-determining protein MreC [Pseudomonadales bacterium]MCP5344196.1 rod shape-determining protein MreC [Pseudomonadales bacterium]